MNRQLTTYKTLQAVQTNPATAVLTGVHSQHLGENFGPVRVDQVIVLLLVLAIWIKARAFLIR